MSLGPPYQILIDTNFINFSIQNKLDIFKASMDCLLAKCIPTITDCVMAELEKLGQKYRVALRIAKDPRFQRLACDHKVCTVAWLTSYPSSHIPLASLLLHHQCFAPPVTLVQGTYADDCLMRRVSQHKCYIVATCDRDLKRRIRKVPGVPIMYIAMHKYSIERFPDVNNAPRNG